jgi:heterodisulfide reductase subunit A
METEPIKMEPIKMEPIEMGPVKKENAMICFLCRCYGQIDSKPAESGQIESGQEKKGVDLQQIKEKIKHPFVKKIQILDSLCLDRDFPGMARQICDSGASKVLICACAASSKGDEIRAGLKDQGIDALVEIADIREGCAWIHEKDRDLATQKAGCIVNMAVAALAEQGASSLPNLEIQSSVLVVGAGPAGLAAATALAKSGTRVHLVERGPRAGGMLGLLQRIGPGNEMPQDYLAPYLSVIKDNPLISFHFSAKLISIEGDAGSFTARMMRGDKQDKQDKQEEQISIIAGAVIIATGARALLPRGIYRYRELSGVISAMEFEKNLKKGQPISGPLVFIQCVGVRDENRPYCSTICCPVTLKNAIQVRTDTPEIPVFVLYRDIMCPGARLERYYHQARSLGVTFIRFDSGNVPKILGKEAVEQVECFDVSLGSNINIQAKTVVLSTGLAPHPDKQGVFSNVTLKKGIQNDTESENFFSVKPLMNPVQTDVPGVFICGSARWPVLADQAVIQGEAAAMKALTLLSGNFLNPLSLSRFRESKFAIACVDAQGCSGCGNCVAACPFEACVLESVGNRFQCRVNPVRCTGCGTCVSVCPNNSIQLPEQTSRAVTAMLLAAFEEDE